MTAPDQPEAITQRLYKPETFADLADLSPSFVYKLVAAGKLRSVKVGRARRIPSSELERIATEGVR